MRKFANIQAVWALIKYWIRDLLSLSSDSPELLPVVMGENFILKMFNLKFYLSILQAVKEKTQWTKRRRHNIGSIATCYEAAFTALSCLLHNLLYWAEKTVFIQSYPTKLWILTQKSFIEQNKMLVLTQCTYLAPNTTLSSNIRWPWFLKFIFNLKWKSRIFLFDFYLFPLKGSISVKSFGL